jgi:thiol-disulfide isomerase/thioredoxin
MPFFPILLLASSQAFSGVKVGEPAAAIELDALLPNQSVANARLTALAGKAVVLEFWATWCGPCYFAIPHLNQLAEQFRDKPIQFLSITDEELPTVEGFLKKRPISGWVGVDRKNALHKAYGFESVPVMVLIVLKEGCCYHASDRTGGTPPGGPHRRSTHWDPSSAGSDRHVSLPRRSSGWPYAFVDFLIRPSTTKEMR